MRVGADYDPDYCPLFASFRSEVLIRGSVDTVTDRHGDNRPDSIQVEQQHAIGPARAEWQAGPQGTRL